MESEKLNILLVDDDEVDVINVRRALIRNQVVCDLYVANDGLAALDLLRSGSVPARRRLILLDLNMPRMNGLEFLEALRSDPDLSRSIVVVLTTSSEERDLVKAYEHNVAGYLVKPVGFAAFMELIGRLHEYWNLNSFPQSFKG